MAQGLASPSPSNTARWVVSRAVTRGRVRRGCLGVVARSRPISPRLRHQLRLAGLAMAEVIAVEPGGPAARGALSVGDLVYRLNDREIASVDDLHLGAFRDRAGKAGHAPGPSVGGLSPWSS